MKFSKFSLKNLKINENRTETKNGKPSRWNFGADFRPAWQSIDVVNDEHLPEVKTEQFNSQIFIFSQKSWKFQFFFLVKSNNSFSSMIAAPKPVQFWSDDKYIVAHTNCCKSRFSSHLFATIICSSKSTSRHMSFLFGPQWICRVSGLYRKYWFAWL